MPVTSRMQPFTFGNVVSLTQIAVPPEPKNEFVLGGSVSVASNVYDESAGKMRPS